MRVIACVITYEPDRDLLRSNLEAVLDQVERVVLVDNASSSFDAIASRLDPRVVLLRQRSNLGLSRAMNAAAAEARRLGAEAVLMLDQDSVVATGLVESLERHLADDDDLAIVAARMIDRNLSRAGDYARGLQVVQASITSGSLVRVRDWDEVDGWDERLFIDYVDFDFCLRLRMLERKIAIDHDTALDHAIGDARRVGRAIAWGHSAFRLRHMASDIIYYARKHRRSPAALQVVPRGVIRAAAVLVRKAVIVAAHERDRKQKLLALAQGTIHGFVTRPIVGASGAERG